MKKWIALVCMAALLLSAVACGGLQGAEPEGKVVSNGGIAVGQGSWIYFINGGMPQYVDQALASTARGRIYRMKADGTQSDAVTKDKAFNMYLFGDGIFYTAPGRDKVLLYRINCDGTGRKKLYAFADRAFVTYGPAGVAVADEKSVTYFDYQTLEKHTYQTGVQVTGMMLSEHYLYYYQEAIKGTNRIQLETGTVETLCEEVGQFLYADDTNVYFVSTRIPYRLNANTMELQPISQAYYQNALLNFKNEVILAVASDEEDKGVYAQPMNNTAGQAVGEGGNIKRIKIFDSAIQAYCANDDYVFVMEAETGDIYRITYDGAEKLKLGTLASVFNVDSMDAVGDTLILLDSEESGCAYRAAVDGSTGVIKIVEE